MKKKVSIIVTIVFLMVLLLSLVACNKTIEKSEFDLPVGSFPSSLDNNITSGELAIINAGMKNDATEDEKKSAVMTLYTIANNSRMNTPVSLMVQNTDMTPKINLGYVSMRGFTLKLNDSWFYQFAAQGVSDDSTAAMLLNALGSQQLQIAYTNGDGKYYYLKEMSDKPECDCSLTVFPYATFKVTKELTEYATEDEFQAARYYLTSQLEINNMNLQKDIIADNANITYDASSHIYKVEFAVDTKNSDSNKLKEWWACANKDLSDAGNSIESYDYWYATMEVWDNGYVKSFISSEKRNAGMAGGETTNAFSYLYDESEIKTLLAQDARFGNTASTFSLNEFYNGYIQIANNKQPAQMSKLIKIVIIVVCVLVVVIVGIIVTVEVLVKKGKLPKLAARRQRRKEKRLAKKNK